MSAVPQRSHQADAGQAQRPVNEFKVVIPENKDAIRYSILQFNGPLNIDPSRWTTCDLKMFREDNRAHAVGTTAIVQDYGEGSEYGRAAREEARRKKYGRQSKKYQHDRQPWRMVLKDPTKEPQERVFRSVCEGGAGEHSDYWIFSKSGDSFQAHKVDDWYRFMPTARHKTLDIDQAEEQFQLRNKVLNQFALKAKIQQTLKDAEEDNGLVTKPTALKIKDDFSDSDEEGGHAEKDESKGILDADAALEKNPKKKKGKQKDKRQRVENAEEVARYESEDGEDEGREYDYMSDSGSDTSREEVNLDEKMDKEMVAVGDETGMRDSSEDEDEEEKDEEKEEAKKQLMKKLKEQDENKEDDNTVRMVDQVDERDSSGSDSDDPDNPGGKTSVLFMQKKRKRTAEDTEKPNGSEKKPKLDIKEEKPAVSEKKPPTPPPPPPAPSISGPPVDKLDEETVRRLLLRKPHTTKELLNKIRPHCGDMSKTDIVARLADILRKIEPHQFRQQVNRKDVLFFSLKPPQ